MIANISNFSGDSCESEFEKSISSKKDKEYRTK